MVRDLTPRSPKWLQWASGLVLIAAGCVQPLAAAVAAPQIPAGQGRIWFYQGYEPPSGGANYAPASIPTIVANGTYVSPARPVKAIARMGGWPDAVQVCVTGISRRSPRPA